MFMNALVIMSLLNRSHDNLSIPFPNDNVCRMLDNLVDLIKLPGDIRNGFSGSKSFKRTLFFRLSSTCSSINKSLWN